MSFFSKSLVVLLYMGASVATGQISHFWIPDSLQSRIDVDVKGSAPEKPLQKGQVDLTTVPQGEMEWDITDEFIPAWEKNTGSEFDINFQVTVRKDQNTWPAGGLIYTSDKENGSGVFFMVAVTPQNGVVFNTNGLDEGAGHKIEKSPAVTLPVWIRLAKTGSVVTGYFKPNENAQWVSLGSLDHGSSTPANPAVGKALFKPGSEL